MMMDDEILDPEDELDENGLPVDEDDELEEDEEEDLDEEDAL